MLPVPLRNKIIAVRDVVAATTIATTYLRPKARPVSLPAWATLGAIISQTATPSVSDLDSLASVAVQAELTAFVAARYPPVVSRLTGALARAKRSHALLELAAAHLTQSLHSSDLHTRVALLKGSASGPLAYPDASWRQRRDLDLLVSPDDFQRVRAALWNSGWRDSPGRESGGQPFAGRTFDMRLRLGAVTVGLDLHRNLIAPAWCGLSGDGFRRDFLSRKVRQPVGLAITDPIDTFIHTVAHIVHAGFHLSMKAFVDLKLLFAIIDHEECARRLAQYRLRTATWACLGVVHRWFGQDVDALRERIRPPIGRARLIDSLLSGQGALAISPAIPRWRAVHGFPVLLKDY